MKRIPFLTEEEIQKLQEVEANSSKEQKKTAEQIEAIYTSGQNILVSASAGSGKTFVMAERILDQLARGIEISQLFISTFTVKAATELKERLEKKSASKSKKRIMSISNNTWAASWQTYPTQPSGPWTLSRKNSLVNMAICLILRQISVFYKTKASNFF
ncbi:uvrD/REP helicase family protein [Streptococcus mitis]|uniref:UvrD/REP helicase family protein n=1 Tax=Streptococcus mitis TaxID=28037 RepID=A0A081SA98_STRMT|nr:uvrD/REP helicase family protein [Streptococcus mitis]